MELWVFGVIAIMTGVIIILVIYIYSLKKSACEIKEEMSEFFATDTNTLISVSSIDKDVCALADSLNDQLRQLRNERRRLQNGDRELKEAVTNIAHDIRTPLTAISGYLQLLNREEKSPNVNRYIEMIENRTEALRTLTEELFQYSVLSSETELKLETLDIGAVLEQSLAAAYGTLVQVGINPIIIISPIKTECVADRSALCRIFENIISNAAKYSDGDMKVEMKDNGEMIFSNHAAGLDTISASRLFERFYTVETCRKSTGLGLSIAKMLTERMGGQIKAQYVEGVLSIHLQF